MTFHGGFNAATRWEISILQRTHLICALIICSQFVSIDGGSEPTNWRKGAILVFKKSDFKKSSKNFKNLKTKFKRKNLTQKRKN